MKRRSAIICIRCLHGAIAIFFLFCIGYIYWAGFTNQQSPIVYGAIAAIFIEGIIVSINRWDCPLGWLHRRVGDEKAFFELFLPQSIAKRAIPFIGVISVIGILLVFFRRLQ